MSGHEQSAAKGQRGKSTADRVFYALVAVCIALAVADFMFHKHTHFDFENWPLFYALVGFVSYVSLVFTAKGLRKILMRPEDYYGEAEPKTALRRAPVDHHDDHELAAAPADDGGEE